MITLSRINLIFILLFFWAYNPVRSQQEPIILDETDQVEKVIRTITIDSVWAGHPVDFSLYTHGDRQYIAYYNSNRNTVVGQRNLNDKNFELYILPETKRETNRGTSSLLAWDAHNYVTMAVDKDGYIHLSGNVHKHPLTYYRSTKPNDISSLEQIFEMIGSYEQNTTYPKFMKDSNGELIYHYRDGGSGNGNEIYNVYDRKSKTWSRMFDTPLTDGQGLMNAYQTQPTLMKDGWYHIYWVWRDTPDASTNHDLSYMKSPDLKNWFDPLGNPIDLPATIEKKSLIVDPIPVQGGIINLSAKLLLDEDNNPVFVYHKFDTTGNTQLYIAQLKNKEWFYHTITDWDYRWEFSGNGSMGVNIRIGEFKKRQDGRYEVGFWHIKYGDGALLLDKNFQRIGKVLKASKPEMISSNREGLQVKIQSDSGDKSNSDTKFILKWETMPKNRDKPRPKPWPAPSQLVLIELKR